MNRRDILRMAAAAPAAAALPPVALASIPSTDPVLDLLAEHRRLLALGNAASARRESIAERYVQEPKFENWQERLAWADQHRHLFDAINADQDYIDFSEQAETFWDQACDVTVKIADTEATSATGALAKLREAVRLMTDGVEFESLQLEMQLVVTALADLERLGIG